jgi:isocitrate lyase
MSASHQARKRTYIREAVEREFAGQMREVLEAIVNDELSADHSVLVWCRVGKDHLVKAREVLDAIRAQTGEDFHDPL